VRKSHNEKLQICTFHTSEANRDGSFGIATGYGMDVEIFLLSTASRPVLGTTQPPIQWIPEAFSQGSN
jgi:hypothetical protein